MSQRNLAHGAEGWVLSLMCGRRIEIQVLFRILGRAVCVVDLLHLLQF
jgi:hypothetical protein